MKTQRGRTEIKIAVLLWVATVAYASSRAADPYAVSTFENDDDDYFMFDDENDDDIMMGYDYDDAYVDNVDVAPVQQGGANNDDDEWWMDPLSTAYDGEVGADDPLLKPVDEPDFSPQRAPPMEDSFDAPQSTAQIEPEDDFNNYMDDPSMDDDYMDDSYNMDNTMDNNYMDDPYADESYMDENVYMSREEQEEQPQATLSSSRSAPVPNDYETFDDYEDDYWADDFDEGYEAPPAPPAPEPEPELEPVIVATPNKAVVAPPPAPVARKEPAAEPPAPQPKTTPTSVQREEKVNIPSPEPLYDPVTPVPAPKSPKPLPRAGFFGGRFGVRRKPTPQKRFDNDDASSLYPATAISAGTTTALVSTVGQWLPKVVGLLSGNPAAVAVVAITVGKFVFFPGQEMDETVPSTPKTKSSSAQSRKKKDSGDALSDDEDEEEELEDEEEFVDDDDDEELEYDEEGEPVRKVKKPVRTPKLDNLERRSLDVQGNSWLGSFVKSSQKNLGLDQPRRSRHESVDELRKRCEQAEVDKANMEREYEKTSWELQETQTELKSLKSSTRHLQAQITDNEEMLDRVVKAERQRAKDELQRMKEAMIQVVEKEREDMRSEFMRQAAELQMAWRKEKEEAMYASSSSSSSSYSRPRRHS